MAADMEHGGAPGHMLASDVWAEYVEPLVGHSTVALRFGVESNNAEEEAWFDHFQVELLVHTWCVSSTHEYYVLVDYELTTPSASV